LQNKIVALLCLLPPFGVLYFFTKVPSNHRGIISEVITIAVL